MEKNNFIDIDNRRIFYTDNENTKKPAVVFIHGFPLDSSMWKVTSEKLKEDFRIITYDIRGLGKSTLNGNPYTFEYLVDDLFLVTDNLQLENFILTGLSMGGYIALRAVQRNPEKIKALVLCDTQAGNDVNEALLGRYINLNIILNDGADEFSLHFMPNVLSEYTRYNNTKVVEYILNNIKNQSQTGLASNLVALATRTDTSEFLSEITCLVLGIVGDHDKVTTPEIMKKMISAIPKARLSVIKNSGHFPPLENPEEFNLALVSFLKEIT
jgi:pimeloyl-ACP methyl ester carboxylesterase